MKLLRNAQLIGFAPIILLFLAYIAFSMPAINFVAPTLNDSATTTSNWTYVNLTSSENLNRSLLEWGNSSGFTNVSMANVSGMASWYVNMTNLADGAYNYTIWAENTTGRWNQTARKYVYVDTTPPYSIYACQDLAIENGSYILARNVSSAGTCFTIKANNITLDGAGYWLNYSQSAAGYGINNSRGYDNLTVKNLNIVQGNMISYAYALLANGMNGGAVRNNTIKTFGTYSRGIYLNASNETAVLNNTISSFGDDSYGIYVSSNSTLNNVSGNTLNLSSADSAAGIYIDSYSASNTITRNSIISSGEGVYGIVVGSQSNSNNVSGNNMTLSENSAGISISTSGSNAIANNTIITSSNGAYSYGILSLDGSSNTLFNNSITLSNGYGMMLMSSQSDAIQNNTIKTSGQSGIGIFLLLSNRSNISGNAMNTSGYAIYLSDLLLNYPGYYNHTIDATNTAQGKPIYYYFANSSIIIENLNNIGQLIVANSTNVTIRNITMSDTDGIMLLMARNSSVSGSNITFGSRNSIYGILAESSDNLTISNNSISAGGNYSGGVYLGYSNRFAIANNTISASGNNGYGIYAYSSDSNIFSNNTLTVEALENYSYGFYMRYSDYNLLSGNGIVSSGGNGYGEYLYNSDANNITRDNIVSSGSYGYGAYLDYSDSNNLLWNNITTSGSSGYGMRIRSSDSNTMSNNTVETSGETGYGASIEGSSASNLISNNILATSNSTAYGIYISADSNTVSRNTITASGNNASGVYIYSSEYNNVSNSTISVTGESGHGLLIASGGSNTISNNIIAASGSSGYGIHLSASASNSIIGGSITSKASYDYSLADASASNTFTNTNFTSSRIIRFNGSSSYFGYNNQSSGSIILKTSVSAAGNITRRLANWNNTLMQWNDTPSSAVTASYILSGLKANTIYKIYNTSSGTQANPYSLATDSGGALQSFSIALFGNTEIKLVDSGAAPTCSDGVQNQGETGVDCGGPCAACSADLPPANNPVNNGTPTTKSVSVAPAGQAITRISVTLKALVSNPSLTAVTKSAVPVAAPEGAIYQYIEISKANFENSNIDNATIEFKVNASWILSNNISNVSLARYNNAWVRLPTTLVNATAEYKMYKAYASGFSYFAIVGEKAAPQQSAPSGNLSGNISAGNSASLSNSSNSSNITDLGNITAVPESGSKTLILGGFVFAVFALGGAAFYLNKKDNDAKKSRDNEKEKEEAQRQNGTNEGGGIFQASGFSQSQETPSWSTFKPTVSIEAENASQNAGCDSAIEPEDLEKKLEEIRRLRARRDNR